MLCSQALARRTRRSTRSDSPRKRASGCSEGGRAGALPQPLLSSLVLMNVEVVQHARARAFPGRPPPPPPEAQEIDRGAALLDMARTLPVAISMPPRHPGSVTEALRHELLLGCHTHSRTRETDWPSLFEQREYDIHPSMPQKAAPMRRFLLTLAPAWSPSSAALWSTCRTRWDCLIRSSTPTVERFRVAKSNVGNAAAHESGERVGHTTS